MTVQEYIRSRSLSISCYNKIDASLYEQALFAFKYRYVLRANPSLPTKKWQEFDALIYTAGTRWRTINHIVEEAIKLL